MTVKFTNNASATLATSINTSVTTIQVTAGQGAQFPTLGAGDFFFATLTDSSNNIEIVKVTSRSSDTLTVVRGQDNTNQKAYVAGDKIELRITAAGLAAIYNDAKAYTDESSGAAVAAHVSDTSDAHDASAISFVPVGGLAATDVQAAIAELDAETPGNDGAGATGTWNINVSGNADTATQTPLFSNGNWTITVVGDALMIRYQGNNRMRVDGSGNITVVGNVTGYGSL
jgi:hypothetical protein